MADEIDVVVCDLEGCEEVEEGPGPTFDLDESEWWFCCDEHLYEWLSTQELPKDLHGGLGVNPSKTPPPGLVVVHNHVQPAEDMNTVVVGQQGFRAWIMWGGDDRYVVCDCGWAPGLEPHYRVDPKLLRH